MSSTLLFLSAALSLLGCICLVFSQRKHATKIFGRHSQLPQPAACQRWAWAFLLLSLMSQLLSDGIDFVIILWPMFFGVNALITALAVAFSPGWLRVLRVLPGLHV